MRGGGRKGADVEKGLDLPDSLDGFGLGTYCWIAYLGSALVLLLALIGAAVIFGTSESRMMEHHLRTYSGTLAQEMSNRIAAVRGQLERWRDDPGLRASLLDGRAGALLDKEAELELLVPGALGVMVFSNKDMAPGGSASRRLSFAGLDMLQQARESGRIASLEAHRLRQHDEHLAIAGPVVDGGGEVVGVVHIKLPLSLLPSPIAEGAGQSSFVFRQRVGDDLVAVQPPDVAPAPAGAPAVRIPIADTRLELFAWSKTPGLLSSGLLPLLAGVYGLALILLGLALVMPCRSLRRGVLADLASMVALAEDAVAQRPLRGARGRVRELVIAAETLRRRLRELSPTRALTPKPAAEPAALAGEGVADEAEPDLESGLDLDLRAVLEPEVLAVSADRTAAAAASAGTATRPEQPVTLPAHIFRAYDIRGLVDTELTAEVMRLLGRAVGSAATARGQGTCVVARDQRPSGAGFAEALMVGLAESGCDILDLGIAPTPLAYYAAWTRGPASAAIVTASHNPAEYNGLKVVLGGRAANEDQIQGLRERILRRDFDGGEGRRTVLDATADYIRAVCDDITLARPMQVVLDCGYATACTLAPALYRALDCEVSTLDCDLHPELADQRELDPSQPKNLDALGKAVVAAGADLGLAFDADGDRLGVVDSAGKFVAADRLLMLLAADVLARAPGSDIVYDVKSSHHVGAAVLQSGGRPVMWKSGHSLLKQKMRELGAPLGGELSGHIVFGERWNGFDDAFYAGARLLEVLALDPRSSAEVLDDFRVGICTPELFVPLAPGEDARIMASVLAMADRLDGVEVNTIDGLRAEFDQGWGLIRSSNTRSGLVFRFEADDETALDKIQDLYRRMMDLVAPDLNLPF